MAGKLAFDTETRGLDWFDPEQQAFLASWADATGEYVADLTCPDGVGSYLRALESADTLVAHNLPFDIHQTRAATGVDVLLSGSELHDTAVRSRVLFPAAPGDEEHGGHGLKNLGKQWVRDDAEDSEAHLKELAKVLGYRSLKSQNGVYYAIWRSFKDELEYYAKMDARLTYDLDDKLAAMAPPELMKVYELERQVMPILIQAEERGVALDQDAVVSQRNIYEQQLEDSKEYLERELGTEALESDDALLEALQMIGVQLHRRTPTGKYSVDKFALQEFEDEHEQVGKLFEYRQAQKYLSTYIGPMLGRDVVHPSFSQCGAWTGRMSCMRPNMQNIPKRGGRAVRSMFVPRPGHAFVVSDYEGIEVRLLAWYLADENYRRMLEEDLDPHAWMAAQIHGGTAADYHKDGPNKDIRGAAKNTMFAITYGAGKRRVADMNKISRDEAGRLISSIKSSLPNYYRLKARIDKKIKASGYVNTLWGRKQCVRRDKSYVGLNALIQGSAADIMKAGLVAVDAALTPLGGRPLLVIHDEVVSEVPLEYAEEALQKQNEAMCSVYPLSPRLETAGKVVTTNFADA